MLPVKRLLFAILLLNSQGISGIGGNAIGSLGEASFNQASDLGGSTVLPQTGFSLDYRTKYLTPYLDLTVGWYNHGPHLEGWAGAHAGYPIGWFKPGITLGRGVQSSNDKRWDRNEEYYLVRRTRQPWGAGLRADLFDRLFFEFEQRGGSTDDFAPWWRLKSGYRIF
jgi:hypothetical protein